MPNVNNIGGKHWVDLGGPNHKWLAQNTNRMRPQGFMYTNVEGGDPAFKVYINPVTWANGTSLDEWPGADITVGPSVTTYVWLDGSQPPASQLQTSTVSFPTPSSSSIFFLGYIVTNGSGVVSIDNIQRTWSGLGGVSAVMSVGASAPITSSGGQNPTIGITPATGVAPGSMSAADKAKLDFIAFTTALGELLISSGVLGQPAVLAASGGDVGKFLKRIAGAPGFQWDTPVNSGNFQVLSTTEDIDTFATGITQLYTVPGGFNAVIAAMVFRPTTTVTPGTGPNSIQIGFQGGSGTELLSESLINVTTADLAHAKTFEDFISGGDPTTVAPPGTVIELNIASAASIAGLLYDVDLIGYLLPV